MQGGNENVGQIGQFVIKRCDQEELRPRLGITQLARLGSNVPRLSPVVLIFFRQLWAHRGKRSREIL